METENDGGHGVKAARAAGIVLIAVPFLPLRSMFGDIDGAQALVPPGEWALGVAICLALAWLLALAVEPLLGRVHARTLPAGAEQAAVATAAAALAIVLSVISRLAFHHRPHLVDSIAQLFQAKIFASGALTAPVPSLPEFFATQQMVMDAGRWYAQYPPGHAALLAVGYAAGATWVVPILLSVGTALLLHRFARRTYDRPTALVTLALTLVCPFLLFMGASHMNHVSTLFFVALFLYLFRRWEEGGRGGDAVLAGLALGGAFLSRPLTALAVGLSFVVPVVRLGWLRSRVGQVVAGATTFLAVAAVYLLYNSVTTGVATEPGYLRLWGSDHGLGFHSTPWGMDHTPLAGLRNELVDLALLDLYLFEWPVPALLPLGLALAAGWLGRAWDRWLLWSFLAIPAAHFFYWHRDAFLGPRFLYSGLAMLLPLTARSLVVACAQMRRIPIRLGGLFRPVRASTVGAVALALCLGYSVLYSIPARGRVYATGLRSMKVDLVGEARAAGIEGGLIFVPVSWGNRIIARLRGAGVPAAIVEVAYRHLDHCRLQELVDSASESIGGAELSGKIETLLALDERTVPADLNEDPTLRLRPGASLTRRCVDALRRDSLGYTVYAPHLIANDPALAGDWIVARDLGDRNRLLRALYPERPAYLFRGGSFARLD